jgi:hypothetical protein
VAIYLVVTVRIVLPRNAVEDYRWLFSVIFPPGGRGGGGTARSADATTLRPFILVWHWDRLASEWVVQHQMHVREKRCHSVQRMAKVSLMASHGFLHNELEPKDKAFRSQH